MYYLDVCPTFKEVLCIHLMFIFLRVSVMGLFTSALRLISSNGFGSTKTKSFLASLLNITYIGLSIMKYMNDMLRQLAVKNVSKIGQDNGK